MAPAHTQKKRKIDQGSAEALQGTPDNDINMESLEEEEEEGVVGDGTSHDDRPARTKHKRKTPSAASADVQHKITDMNEYKSNVFRMETEEMLAQVQIDYQRRMGPVEKALHKLKNIIDSLPEHPPMLICDAEKEIGKTHKIVIPFPNPRPAKDIKYKFAYEKPSYINVVGSFALKTMIKAASGNMVDLVLQMPQSLFQEKDYLNYRYFHKRAYYLACLAGGIQDADGFTGNLSFALLNGDSLRPVLIVSPSTDGGDFDYSKSKCTIRIIPCIPPGTFSLKKLAPDKNCVRFHSQEDGPTMTNLPPTPSYNSSILADTTYLVHLKLLHATASQSAAFREACMLGRIWLRQRGFTSDIALGGFGSFEWSILMAYLMKVGSPMGTNVLGAGYSNYQLFKATLQYIATKDLAKEPLIFNSNGINLSGTDIPILFDGEHGVNILFKMTPWSYKMLRHEASMTVKALNASAQDQFDAIFLNRVEEPCLKYDVLANIPFPVEAANNEVVDSTDQRITFACKLFRVLAYGLTDRVTMINLKLPQIEGWDIRKQGGDFSHANPVTASFLLDGEKCARLMDHGPPAENKKDAASFRKFWGEKAELRRFKDGSILESVYWGDKNASEPVFYRVVSYLVKHHFSLETSQGITFIGDEYTQLLSKHQQPGTQATTKLFQPTMTGYETLVRDLRALDDLPLTIRHITPISPALRYSTIQSPLPGLHTGVYMDPPADVALQFESSGRWPDNLIAIQRTKIAFLLKIGQLLEESSSQGEIHCRAGLENQEPDCEIFNASFLDVIYSSGPVFRIRIHHEREPVLLERRMKDKTLSPHTRELAAEALKIYNRIFIKSPLHTTSVAKFCHRYEFLSPTIRLVKKWFAAHLLTNHFSEEFIELVVLRTFSLPFPWATPSSVMTGFLRVLEFLATWDWRVDPLIVDTNEDPSNVMKAADVEAIIAKFEAVRKSDPGFNRHVLFAATNYDHDGLVWTESGPSMVVASRMTQLARSASEYAKKMGHGENEGFKVATLFAHSLTDYDFVIHLSPAHLPGGKAKNSGYKNLATQNVGLISFDPAGLYLRDLQSIYSSNLVFFHGTPSSTTIGCLWTPHTAAPRPWKFNLTYSTIPSIPKSSEDEKTEDDDGKEGLQNSGLTEERRRDKGLLSINKQAMINEMAILGGDLVSKIVVTRP